MKKCSQKKLFTVNLQTIIEMYLLSPVFNTVLKRFFLWATSSRFLVFSESSYNSAFFTLSQNLQKNSDQNWSFKIFKAKMARNRSKYWKNPYFIKVLQNILYRYACIPVNPFYSLENDHDRCSLFPNAEAWKIETLLRFPWRERRARSSSTATSRTGSTTWSRPSNTPSYSFRLPR